jgi:TolA-binding protein
VGLEPRRSSTTSTALAVVLLLAGSAGCAGAEALQQDVAALRREIADLRAREGALSERLEAVERGRRGAAPAVDAEAAGDRPELEVVRLVPPTPEEAETQESTRIRIRSTPGGLVEEDASGGGKDVSSTPAADLKKAKDLYEKKSWDGAIAAFSSFLVKHPRDPAVPEVTLLRGLAYATKNDPGKAASQLEAVVESYPESAAAPEALLELVKVRNKLGDKAGAEKARDRLLSTYPKSSAAKKLGAARSAGGEPSPPNKLEKR